jgi:hypothetical protein
MISRSLPPTTHTLEMAQVVELNERLRRKPGAAAITAASLGMGGAPLQPAGAGRLTDDAVLVRLSWQGSPEFPDIYGHFGRTGLLQALLHTASLNQLGHQLNVRQRWGIGLPRGTPREHDVTASPPSSASAR